MRDDAQQLSIHPPLEAKPAVEVPPGDGPKVVRIPCTKLKLENSVANGPQAHVGGLARSWPQIVRLGLASLSNCKRPKRFGPACARSGGHCSCEQDGESRDLQPEWINKPTAKKPDRIPTVVP
jgi:hypothetical protein